MAVEGETQSIANIVDAFQKWCSEKDDTQELSPLGERDLVVYELMADVARQYKAACEEDGMSFKDFRKADFSMLLAAGSYLGCWPKTIIGKIQESSLPEPRKETLEKLFDKAISRVGEKGLGFFSNPRPNVDDEAGRVFVELVVRLIDVADDPQNFEDAIEIYDDVIGKAGNLKGVGLGWTSQILHTLKPTIFPICNGNQGGDGYSMLDGVDIQSGSYSDTARSIQEFRSEEGRKEWWPKGHRWFDCFTRYIESPDEKHSTERGTMRSKNTILYGPPGTGKTYETMRKALEIIEISNTDGLNDEDIPSMYKERVSEGRIGFVTFHQSFAYEDFVEGLRPKLDGDNDDEGDAAELDGGTGKSLEYELRKGVFKEFCDTIRSSGAARDEGLEGLNDRPKVWKVSLKGTGENEVRTDCLRNGYVRFGGNYDNLEQTAEGIFQPRDGGDAVKSRELNTLYNRMQEGDLVCSCYSQFETDAIGIIAGTADYDADLAEYKHKRPVRWIWTAVDHGSKPLNIRKLNGNKRMTRSSAYELKSIDPVDLLEEAGLTGPNDDASASMPYVFIIDEINRGNVSAIFGELITLIEDNKRLGELEEKKALLPYSQKEWGVPSNVYIIATMNTADRSLAHLDTALRRRFTFEEVMPNSQVIRDQDGGEFVDNEVNLAELLDAMNKRIEILYDREHTLGHAYLLGIKSLEELRERFAQKVIPQLQEYFFDDYEKIRMVLNDFTGAFVKREEADADIVAAFSKNFEYRDQPEHTYSFIKKDWDYEDFKRIYEPESAAGAED